jgi:hypothetical protein
MSVENHAAARQFETTVLARQAQQLAMQWQSLRGRHAPIGIGCSCCAPAALIPLGALEDDVIAHLERKYAHEDNEAIARILACERGERTLAAIIERLVAALAESQRPRALLDDLQRSIGSLARTLPSNS